MAAPANNLSSAKTRILTGISLGGVFLAALLGLPTGAWAGVMLGVIALGAWEWAGLSQLPLPLRVAYAGASALLVFALHRFVPADPVALVSGGFWLLLVPVWLSRRWGLPGGVGGMLSGWMVLVPAGYAAIALHARSPALLLGCILLAVIADSAAYFTGRRFGRHKLAPRISPGKSWEGALGAGVAVALYALAVSLATCGPDCIPKLQLFAFILFVVSILGDLFESHAKRQAGIKDSGAWLPGHGGVLDRIDSLTAVLPVALALLLFFPET